MVLTQEIEQLKLQQQEKEKVLNDKNLEKSEQKNSELEPELKMDEQNLKLKAENLRIKEIKMEENLKSKRDLENSETAHIIEEIIEGISLQGRRGTLVRTISAVLR